MSRRAWVDGALHGLRRCPDSVQLRRAIRLRASLSYLWSDDERATLPVDAAELDGVCVGAAVADRPWVRVGAPNRAVTAEIGASGDRRRRRSRFVEHRFNELVDDPRPGAQGTLSDDQIEQLIVTTLEQIPKDATHWSTRSIIGWSLTLPRDRTVACSAHRRTGGSTPRSPDPPTIRRPPSHAAETFSLSRAVLTPDRGDKADSCRIGVEPPPGLRVR